MRSELAIYTLANGRVRTVLQTARHIEAPNWTPDGSSLIIMSIVGGAILPPLFAWIADSTGNIQLAYIVPLVCFAVILYFGLRGYRVKPTLNAA